MNHLINAISTDSLCRLVEGIQVKLIHGTARADDIEAYIRMQWEIAERELGWQDAPIDPRD